jgi:hypothetical protein
MKRPVPAALVPAALVTALAACDGGPMELPGAPEPTGVLRVVVTDPGDHPAFGAADSALVRIRNLFVDPGRFSVVQRVALDAVEGTASVDVEVPARTGYQVTILAYHGATAEAVAGGRIESGQAVVVAAEERTTVEVPLVRWRAELEPPDHVLSGQTAAFALRFVEGPPLPGGVPPVEDPWVHSWGLMAGFEPWGPTARPAPVPPGVRGYSATGSPPVRTFYVYHPAPAVEAEARLYLEGYFEVGGAEWREDAGGEGRVFRLHTQGLESVRVVYR